MTPAEKLLHRLRQATRVEGFEVRLTERRSTLYLHRQARTPDMAATIAFFTILTGNTCDRVEIWRGHQPVIAYRLIDKSRWVCIALDASAEAA